MCARILIINNPSKEQVGLGIHNRRWAIFFSKSSV